MFDMQISQVQFDPTQLSAIADGMNPRSRETLHLSAIYRDIEETIATKKRAEMSAADLDAYRAQGFLFERIVSNAMRDSLLDEYMVRPGELKRDGIVGSPDIMDLRDNTIWETKATYKSFNKMGDGAQGLSQDFWIWSVQIKGYCQMAETTKAKLLALFVNGDYKTYKPLFKAWEMEFSPRELDENWRMIVQHAKKRGWL